MLKVQPDSELFQARGKGRDGASTEERPTPQLRNTRDEGKRGGEETAGEGRASPTDGDDEGKHSQAHQPRGQRVTDTCRTTHTPHVITTTVHRGREGERGERSTTRGNQARSSLEAVGTVIARLGETGFKWVGRDEVWTARLREGEGWEVWSEILSCDLDPLMCWCGWFTGWASVGQGT